MKNKKNLKGKKYSKLAIASFVIGLFILLNFILSIISFFITFENIANLEYFIFLFSTGLIIPISITSIILGIVALIRIKKNKSLKGKSLAIIGVIIPLLVLIWYIAFSILIGGL